MDDLGVPLFQETTAQIVEMVVLLLMLLMITIVMTIFINDSRFREESALNCLLIDQEDKDYTQFSV